MLRSRHQKAGRNNGIANRPFEKAIQLKYVGTRATNQNLIQEEIKGRSN
jgi:hypothetical protein